MPRIPDDREQTDHIGELVTLTTGTGKAKRTIQVTIDQLRAGWGAGDERWGKACEKALAAAAGAETEEAEG